VHRTATVVLAAAATATSVAVVAPLAAHAGTKAPDAPGPRVVFDARSYTVKAGATLTLKAVAADAAGNVLIGAPVLVATHDATTGAWSWAKSGTTDKAGRLSVAVKPNATDPGAVRVSVGVLSDGDITMISADVPELLVSYPVSVGAVKDAGDGISTATIKTADCTTLFADLSIRPSAGTWTVVGHPDGSSCTNGVVSITFRTPAPGTYDVQVLRHAMTSAMADSTSPVKHVTVKARKT
jgi:hypothetical protein